MKLPAVGIDSSNSHYARTSLGKPMLKHFLFDPKYKNLNQGSFGTYPLAIREKQRQILDLVESAPDPHIRYTYPTLLDENRLAISKLLNAPVEGIVLVPNASTAFNTVIRSIVWNDDGKDEVLYYSTIYGACGNTIEYLKEYTASKVTGRKITISYPIEDVEVVQLLKDAILKSRKEGKRPRVVVFDTVSSVPGVRVPFETLTALCHEEGLLSLIDGAHGAGSIKLDLEKLNPDFFLSNCHKWLFAPRGCCVLYVPLRNQAMIRSTLPTSHGYIPPPSDSTIVPRARNPYFFKMSGFERKSDFLEMFEFVGTVDNSAYLCISEAIKFRQEVCGGEEAILSYTQNLAKAGGARVASILDTYVLDNKTETITNCPLVNVRMPLTTQPEELKEHPTWTLVTEEDAKNLSIWMTETMTLEYNSYVPVFSFQDGWWTRLSAQVYLDIDDFEWTGNALKELCTRQGWKGWVY